MRNTILNTMSGGAALPSDPNAEAYFTAAGIIDPTMKSAWTTFVLGSKNSPVGNIYAKYRAAYPLLGGTSTSHQYNAINPVNSNAAFRLTFTATTHSSNGITFNGSSGFADTHIQATTVFGSNPLGIHNYYRVWGVGVGMGNDGAVLDNSFVGNIQLGGSNANVHPLWTVGMVSISRSGSNMYKVYNGQSSGNIADSFVGYSTGNIRIGATSFVGFSDTQNALCIVTDGMSVAEIQALNVLAEAYQVALGRNTPTVHFFGDSYTEGVVNSLSGFTTQLSNTKRWIEKNYGVGGTEVGAMDITLIPTYRAGYDKYIWISYGLNEAGHNASPASTFAAILSSRVDSCIAKGWPANRIVINCGFFANSATWTSYGFGANDARYQTFITAYQGVATAKGTLFVNPFAQTDATDLQGDHVHWAASGVTKGVAYFASQIP